MPNEQKQQQQYQDSQALTTTHFSQDLDRHQQDLLLKALRSQRQDQYPSTVRRRPSDPQEAQQIMTTVSGNAGFISPQQAELDAFDAEYTPELDYLDGDDGYDFDNADLGGEMIGGLPEQHDKRKNPDGSDAADDDNEAKRQDMSQDGDKGAKKPGRKPLTNEPTTKRKAQNRAAQRAFRERKERHLKDLETKVGELTKAQEADNHEKGLLKAQVERLHMELREYRKRLSMNGGISRSPPPTASKSQTRSNSGGQQSFQFDFPKFGALPGSQIFGDQPFATNGATINTGLIKRDSVSPPTLTHSPTTRGNSFDSAHPLGREDSSGRSASPKSVHHGSGSSRIGAPGQLPEVLPYFEGAPYSTNDNMHGFAATLPQMETSSSDDPFSDLFSPSLIKSANMESNGFFSTARPDNGVNRLTNATLTNGHDGETMAGLNRVFQFNSNSSPSDSASPSASSSTQWNAHANSSCGTSPEPIQDSPATRFVDNKTTGFSDHVHTLRQGNPSNWVSDITNAPNHNFAESGIAASGNAGFSIPTSTPFDPVLFGDYRDTHDPSFGGSDFAGTLFDNEFSTTQPFDFGSPSNLFGILQSPSLMSTSLQPQQSTTNTQMPSATLMAQMEKLRDGGDDEYGLQAQSDRPATDRTSSGKLISCNNIWNQLQSNPDFQDGKFDLDGLCSELRAKARCSESGVMVDQEIVDAALRKLGKKDAITGMWRMSTDVPVGLREGEIPPLLFEQESWDNVLKKLTHSSG